MGHSIPIRASKGPLFKKGVVENNKPVGSVSWYSAQDFIKELSVITGRKFRLPSESEWEYACKAGTDTVYPFGDMPGMDIIGNYVWYEHNSNNAIHSVGQKLPNPWGFCDMLGNISEWCEDSWVVDHRHIPLDGSAVTSDIPGAYKHRRVIKGGYGGSSCVGVRSSSRYQLIARSSGNNTGFRLAL
ncbi:MAG: formylglycine-generating enzyme family protein [bacterium]|nr:formylglycine-generating enzyme family protein [bacterium]